MATEPASDVGQLLHAAAEGDPGAADQLFPVVYEELHRIASSFMRRERHDHTLQTTALVHEAFIRLVGGPSGPAHFENLRHFMATAAIAMRGILVNHAKSKRAQKRGGGRPNVSIEEIAAEFNDRAIDLLALNESLEVLATLDERQARIVEWRFFGGMGVADCAAALGVSTRTVEYEWAHARAWLRSRLEA